MLGCGGVKGCYEHCDEPDRQQQSDCVRLRLLERIRRTRKVVADRKIKNASKRFLLEL
jgi:hypothetical protein